MAIVGGKAVREEQANGLICCVNKRMLVTAQQWHISVALRHERGLERACDPVLSDSDLRGKDTAWLTEKCLQKTKIIGATTEASHSLHLSFINPEEMLQTKGGHSSRQLYGSHFVVFPLFLQRQRVKTSFFFISNNTWADTSPLHTFLCYLHCVVRPLKQ